MLKSTGLSLFALQLLPPKSAKSREILRKFEPIAVHGHPTPSILVPIKSSYAYINYGHISYRFQDIHSFIHSFIFV